MDVLKYVSRMACIAGICFFVSCTTRCVAQDTIIYSVDRELLFGSKLKRKNGFWVETKDHTCFLITEKAEYDKDKRMGQLRFNRDFDIWTSEHWTEKKLNNGQLGEGSFDWLKKIITDEFFRVITFREKRRLRFDKTGLIVCMEIDNFGVPRLIYLDAYVPLKGRISRKSFLKFHSFLKSLRFYPSYDASQPDSCCLYICSLYR